MKRVGILSIILAIVIFVGAAVAADVEPTDVKQPGTQQGETKLETPDRCDNCHGAYDSTVEPYFNWQGSMMAQAGRDPIFWATLAIAEQDFDGVGDMCIRCHSTSGWINDNSTPTDGSGLGSADADGVDCDFCHKMTNPDNSEYLGVMIAPFIANDGGTPATGFYGTGMVSLWDGSEKLGPYAESEARHQFFQSTFHRSKDYCGSCHDVSNPVVGDLAHNNGAQSTADPVVASGILGGPVEDKAAFNNFPYMYGVVERTYSEYYAGVLSTFRVADYSTLPADLQDGAIEAAYLSSGGDYEDGTPRYYTCQTCHMSAVTGKGADMSNAPIRTDLPLHDMTGGNYWAPDAIQYQDNLGILRLGGGLNATQIAALDAGKARALNQLSLAADLSVSGDILKVTNLTGHKLITGYPEGRRMWLNIKWYDDNNIMVREDGEYGDMTVSIDGSPTTVRSIIDLQDPNAVIYEAHYGMTQEWGAQLLGLGYSASLPLAYDRETGAVTLTLGDLAADTAGSEEETFHFVLNNTLVTDNRIPPYGFSYDEARVRNALPVPANQYGDPGAGGTYNYWDDVALNPPSGAVYAEISLMYQPTSWEYIQFLYLGNDQQNAFLGEEGINILDTWLNTGMAEPEVMATTQWSNLPTPQYALTINVDGSGSVTPDPDKPLYYDGENVELTAVPEPGWTFSGWMITGWSGSISSTSNPVSISMNEDKIVTATFTPDTTYTLTVNIVGSGTVTQEPDLASYNPGETVTLTAVPAAGWSFAGWSGDLISTSNPETITMDANKTVTATFTPDTTYTLTVNIVGSGTVTQEPDLASYNPGETVTLTAVPAAGWSFAGWSDDLSGTANPETITMDANKTVTATFTPDFDYTLTVNIVGSGTVTQEPDLASYNPGEEVTLTAVPAAGWSFAGWSGDLISTTNPETITMDANKTVTATFTPDTSYTLTVNIVGSGTVTQEPDLASYNPGEEVTLTAVPAAGWSFAGWSDDLSGTANPETITMDGDKTVTATFTPDFDYTLTVNVVGSGTVTQEPDLASYNPGEEVTLTAVPAAGWSFAGWSGDLISTTNPETITMDANKTVTATFTPDTSYTLTVNIVGSGTVTQDPDRASYNPGEEVTLTAVPAAGWSFAGWSDDLSGTANPETITMDANKTVTATFTPDTTYTLTVNVVGSGTVTQEPDLASYNPGETVTLTAVPAAGWSFADWSGDLISTTNPETITMNGDKTVTATFTPDTTYTFTVNIVGSGTVTQEPDLASYNPGEEVTLTAVPAAGWSFAGWSDDLSGTANPETITMNGDKTVTATFSEDGACDTPAIPVLQSPENGSISSDATPLLSWNAADNADEYEIQIDTDPAFSAPSNALVQTTSYTPPILPDGMNYWRVRGYNNTSGCDVYGPWSEVWSVDVDTSPPVATLDYPFTNSSVVKPRTLINVTISNLSGVASVSYSAYYSGEWHLLTTDQDGSDGWLYVWPIDDIPNQIIQVRAEIVDTLGNQTVLENTNISLQSTFIFGNGYESRGGSASQLDYCSVTYEYDPDVEGLEIYNFMEALTSFDGQ